MEIQKKAPIDYSDYPFKTVIHKVQGYQAAYMERVRLEINEGSLVNIYSLLRKQGVHIFRRRLQDSNIAGVYLKHPNAGHCILINYEEDLYRQSFSIAHEYYFKLTITNIVNIIKLEM